MKKINPKRPFNSKSRRNELEILTNKLFKAKELKRLTGLKGKKSDIIDKLNKKGLYQLLDRKKPLPASNVVTILTTEKGWDAQIDKVENFHNNEITKKLKNAKSVAIIFKRGLSRKKQGDFGREIPKYFYETGGITPNFKVKTQKELMEFVADTMEEIRSKIGNSLKPDEEPFPIRNIFLKFYYDEKK